MNLSTVEQEKTLTILFLAGFCLMLLQFFMIREISAVLKGTEIVILLVTLAYFSGYSAGYALSDFLSLPALRLFALIFWAIHLTLPFSLRYFSAFLFQQSPGWTFILIVFFSMFLVSSFYSVLLPWFIGAGAEDGKLARLYGTELAGAATGALVALAFGSWPMAQPLLYQLALAGTVFLIWPAKAVGAALIAGLAAYLALFNTLDRHSLKTHYENSLHFIQAEPLSSVNSPYQKVDFMRSGMTGKNYIFLDGNMNFGSTSLEKFNMFLSRLPAMILKPEKALIIGAGSMQSARNVAPLSGWVDIVEIDRAIVDGSRKYMTDINRIDELSNWSLTIQDAKNYLGATDKKYDLIIIDVPAPLTIQVGLLHSVEFYSLARSRLTSHGVLSISLSGTFKESQPTPRTVAAAAFKVFPEAFVIVPEIPGRSFILAGNSLSFGRKEIEQAASQLVEEKTAVYDYGQALRIIGDAPPISLKNPGYPVKRSFRSVMFRYFWKVTP